MAQPQHLSAYRSDPAPRAYTSKKSKQQPESIASYDPRKDDPNFDENEARLRADRAVIAKIAKWNPKASEVFLEWAQRPRTQPKPKGVGNSVDDDEANRIANAWTDIAVKWVEATISEIAAASGDRWGCSVLVSLLLWIYRDGRNAEDFRYFSPDHPYPHWLQSAGISQSALWKACHRQAYKALAKHIPRKTEKS